jgi:hypothetical protein
LYQEIFQFVVGIGFGRGNWNFFNLLKNVLKRVCCLLFLGQWDTHFVVDFPHIKTAHPPVLIMKGL